MKQSIYFSYLTTQTFKFIVFANRFFLLNGFNDTNLVLLIMWVQEVILKIKTNVIINKLDILYSTPTQIFSFVFIQLRRTNVLFSWDHALIKK